jgi:hypothetical protein
MLGYEGIPFKEKGNRLQSCHGPLKYIRTTVNLPPGYLDSDNYLFSVEASIFGKHDRTADPGFRNYLAKPPDVPYS